MANRIKGVAENVPGEFFVDSTCIDCDTCRQLSPTVFAEGDDHAFVYHQPGTPASRRSALQALVSCPTGSIGTLGDDDPKSALADFPLLLEKPVFYCGFNSAKSYGGNSYAGIPGRSRRSPCAGSFPTSSSGCSPATVSGSTCRTTK